MWSLLWELGVLNSILIFITKLLCEFVEINFFLTEESTTWPLISLKFFFIARYDFVREMYLCSSASQLKAYRSRGSCLLFILAHSPKGKDLCMLELQQHLGGGGRKRERENYTIKVEGREHPEPQSKGHVTQQGIQFSLLLPRS